MRYLDTNIFLRYLVRPASPLDAQKQQACSVLLQRLRDGQEQATTCEANIAEILYNLCSPRQYRLSHQDASARLRPLLMLRGLKLTHKRVYLRALDLFATHSALDFEDALLVAHMEHDQETELYSYDTDFDRVPGITRQEP
jgi:predicted nucleic acid-binding protein